MQGRRKLSVSKTLEILGRIPNDASNLSSYLRRDLDDIEHLLTCTIKYEIKLLLRVQGHAAIQESTPLLLEKPNDYPQIAHQSYIEEVTVNKPLLVSANEIRKRYNIELSDDRMKVILRNACRIERTRDEPKLVVLEQDGDIVAIFDH